MIGASPAPRYGRLAIGPEKYGRECSRPIQQGDVLRGRDRNSVEGRDRLIHMAASFEQVAENQNDGESETMAAAATEGQAHDKSVLIHAVDAAAPGPLGLGDHLATGPRCDFEPAGNHSKRIVVVSDQGRSTVAEPDRLGAAMDLQRRPIVAENAMGYAIGADEGAGPVVMGQQFRHVTADCRATIRGGSRVCQTFASIPAFGFVPSSHEARQPGLARQIFALEVEALQHCRRLAVTRLPGVSAPRTPPRPCPTALSESP